MSPHFGVGRQLFLPRLSVHHKIVSVLTWKQFKMSSWNFIQILTYIRTCAELKNDNSCIYSFWVMPLWSINTRVIWSFMKISWMGFKLHSGNDFMTDFLFVRNRQTVCLFLTKRKSVIKSFPLCNLKPIQDIFMKLHITLVLILFDYAPLNLSVCQSQNRIRCVTWKPFKILHLNINQHRRHAERKNHNCIFILFELCPFELCKQFLRQNRVHSVT